jgi:hypothetical protein
MAAGNRPDRQPKPFCQKQQLEEPAMRNQCLKLETEKTAASYKRVPAALAIL